MTEKNNSGDGQAVHRSFNLTAAEIHSRLWGELTKITGIIVPTPQTETDFIRQNAVNDAYNLFQDTGTANCPLSPQIISNIISQIE
ncbi:MAG TPA: hypothetical protein VFN51_00225 [Candidatus Saccharimonadales bacterium]|nr:hypothetical protein [Candidatus Saccharimonadales bacterium]